MVRTRQHWRHGCILGLTLALLVGHSGGLQLFAWAGMLISRTQDVGWSQAIETTFDGQHPCCVCVIITALDADDAAPKPQAPKPDKTNSTKTARPHDSFVPAATAGQTEARCTWGFGVQHLDAQHQPAPEPPPPRADATG